MFFYLASAKLIAYQMSPNLKNTQKPTTVLHHISINNGWMGTFQAAILCTCMVGRHMSHINKIFVHLGGGGAWWSIRNHGWIVFVGPILLLSKLAIYCNYIWYILCAMDFYVLGLQYPCFGWSQLYMSGVWAKRGTSYSTLAKILAYSLIMIFISESLS